MNHKEKLIEIYKRSFDISDVNNISDKIMEHVNLITSNQPNNE